MNLKQAKELNALAARAAREVKNSKQFINQSIDSMRRQKGEAARYVDELEKDKDNLFKFAETHTEEEVKAYSDKILAKWQSK